MTILDAIPPGSLVALDTVAWIYEFEANPVFSPVTNVLFRDGFGAGRFSAACSLLVLGELLVQPLARGRPDLADRYRQLIVSGPDLAVWEVSRAVLESAASLRARYRVKTLDAIHIASAVVNSADRFITNDEGLRRIQEVRVLILADYLPQPPGSVQPNSAQASAP
jgi:predicted nucleic acid-binding protein